MRSVPAERQAAAEGLQLERTDSSSGYMGVRYYKDCSSKPYEARLSQAGRKQSLGYFATAAEAATEAGEVLDLSTSPTEANLSFN